MDSRCGMSFDSMCRGLLGESLDPLAAALGSAFALTEAVEMADRVRDVLISHGMEIPDDPIIKSVAASDKDGYFDVRTDRKSETRKIGSVLRMLYPKLTDVELSKLVDEIKAAKSSEKDKIEFRLEPDVYEAYRSICVGKLESCQTGRYFKKSAAKFYSSQAKNAQLLLLYKNDEIVGRALLWRNVKGAKGGMYLDRTYPADDMVVRNIFVRHAAENDWSYRGTNDIKVLVSVENCDSRTLEYQCANVRKLNVIPFLDTFRYGDSNGSFSNSNTGKTMEFDEIEGTNFKLEAHMSSGKYTIAMNGYVNGRITLSQLLDKGYAPVLKYAYMLSETTEGNAMDSMRTAAERRLSLDALALDAFILNVGVSDESLGAVLTYIEAVGSSPSPIEYFETLLDNYNLMGDYPLIMSFMAERGMRIPDSKLDEMFDGLEFMEEDDFRKLASMVSRLKIDLGGDRQRKLVYYYMRNSFRGFGGISPADVIRREIPKKFKKLCEFVGILGGLGESAKEVALKFLGKLTEKLIEMGNAAGITVVDYERKFKDAIGKAG
jgi:hypothetical protein